MVLPGGRLSGVLAQKRGREGGGRGREGEREGGRERGRERKEGGREGGRGSLSLQETRRQASELTMAPPPQTSSCGLTQRLNYCTVYAP